MICPWKQWKDRTAGKQGPEILRCFFANYDITRTIAYYWAQVAPVSPAGVRGERRCMT